MRRLEFTSARQLQDLLSSLFNSLVGPLWAYGQSDLTYSSSGFENTGLLVRLRWLSIEGEESIMEEGKFDLNEMKDNTDHADQDPSPSIVEEVKLLEVVGMEMMENKNIFLLDVPKIIRRHMIKVLMRMKVIEVPMSYIKDRWRKDIKRGYQSISNIYDDYGCDGKRLRYNTLTPLMQEVQQLGAESDDICSILVEIMKDTKEKLIIAMENGQSRAEQLEEASTSGTKAIHSPLKVRTKGHPPTKRKQSKVEQIVKKSFVKARKKL
ncbi:hypothetical protein ZIOFF_055911 [Zingiber officinale]|uniref:Protein FAR1-RELATED SEQUENCE n=1 Tax=Zingiber officinale TaxID=94328 RepID=A0A8J5KSJ8_ZINOF|nr:hypothetical protein ZIOFF_055911 [Zingiber officinale]